MVPAYTHLVECYSPLARQRELFYTGACEKCLPPLPFWMRSVLPGWCSTELPTNGQLSLSRFWRAERCVMLRYSGRSEAFRKKCCHKRCVASSATAWCNARYIPLCLRKWNTLSRDWAEP